MYGMKNTRDAIMLSMSLLTKKGEKKNQVKNGDGVEWGYPLPRQTLVGFVLPTPIIPNPTRLMSPPKTSLSRSDSVGDPSEGEVFASILCNLIFLCSIVH